MSDKPFSDKPLYDELMNLVTEIGELEVENRLLKDSVVNLKNLQLQKEALSFKVYSCKKEIEELRDENMELMASLIEYNQATFKKRLRYLFTGEL